MPRRAVMKDTTTIKSNEHGEVESITNTSKVTEIHTSGLGIEPPYVKLYFENIAFLHGIPMSMMNTMHSLLRYLDYDGYITLSARIRRNLCKEIKICDKTLSNRLGVLVKTGLMKRVSNNDFLVNPEVFGKGRWEDIVKQRKEFRVTVNYSAHSGKEVKTDVLNPQLTLCDDD